MGLQVTKGAGRRHPPCFFLGVERPRTVGICSRSRHL